MARPETTNRDRVLAVLRVARARDEGVKVRALQTEHGIPCPRVHLESLRFEPGLAIEYHPFTETDERGMTRSGIEAYLTEDEWADTAVEPAG